MSKKLRHGPKLSNHQNSLAKLDLQEALVQVGPAVGAADHVLILGALVTALGAVGDGALLHVDSGDICKNKTVILRAFFGFRENWRAKSCLLSGASLLVSRSRLFVILNFIRRPTSLEQYSEQPFWPAENVYALLSRNLSTKPNENEKIG